MFVVNFEHIPQINPFQPSISIHAETSHLICSVTKTTGFYMKWNSGLKVGVSPSKKIIFISLNESPLKMMKNAFYFILKLFSFSRYLNFCLGILVMRLISKLLTSQAGKQTITTHILPNTSRSKDNHTLKFGQVI